MKKAVAVFAGFQDDRVAPAHTVAAMEHGQGAADDAGAMDALKGLPLFTFGCCEGADCQARNLTWQHGRPDFDVVAGGE